MHMQDIFGFAGKIGMSLIDSADGQSYGFGENIRFDTFDTGVAAQSTNGPGWEFSNLGVNATVAPITMPVGGAKSPIVFWDGGTSWGSAKDPTNAAGGTLKVDNVSGTADIPSETGAGGRAITKIAEVVVAAPQATIDFSSIPNTYRSLWLKGVVRTSNAAEFGIVGMRFNADNAANYDETAIDQFNNVVSGGGAAGQTSSIIARVLAANATANRPGYIEALIYNYAGTTWQKMHMTKGGYID